MVTLFILYYSEVFHLKGALMVRLRSLYHLLAGAGFKGAIKVYSIDIYITFLPTL